MEIENEAVWTYATELGDGKRYDVTSVLTMTVNRTDDDRVYRCSVVNVAMATPISATVQLTVHCEPISFVPVKRSISYLFARGKSESGNNT